MTRSARLAERSTAARRTRRRAGARSARGRPRSAAADPVQQLAAPQQRVVAVVVRVGRVDAGTRPACASAQGDERQHAATTSARLRRPAAGSGGAGARPGERRARHVGYWAPASVRRRPPLRAGRRRRPRPRMKLIIQIPCLNEEETLPVTLADLPREVAGLRRRSSGSSSTTARPTAPIEVARAHGVDHIVRLTNNKGLAAGFQAGLDACAEARRRRRSSTPTPTTSTTAPTSPSSSRRSSRGEADMVVGDREVDDDRALLAAEEAPAAARQLGRAPGLGHRASPDTTSGFRAYNREAALAAAGRLQVHLHARDDHPGGQDAGRDRPRPDRDEPEDARVAPVRRRCGAYVRRNARLDLPHLRAVRAAAGLHAARRRSSCVAGARRLGAASSSTGSSTATAPATCSR